MKLCGKMLERKIMTKQGSKERELIKRDITRYRGGDVICERSSSDI